MKRLYSLFLILLLAGCATAEPGEPPTPTVPAAWLTRPPTPAVTAVPAVPEPGPLPPTAAPTVPLPAVATALPTPEPSLLDTLLDVIEPDAEPWTLTTIPGVPAEIVVHAQQIATENPEQFTWVHPDSSEADVRLTINEGKPLAQWIYVAAAPFATVADDISAAELVSLWQRVVEGEEALVMSLADSSSFSALWGAPGPVLNIASGDSLREQLWDQRPSRTILPFPTLTPDLKLLTVDGQSPLNPAFDPATYPLTLDITVSGPPEAIELFRDLWDGPTSNYDPNLLTTVAMTGVTALVRATATQMEIDGILAPARDVGPVLQAADFAHISNEVSFAPDCPEPNPIGGTTFCSQDEYFALLTEIGTDIVELTGNHLNDWGTDNLIRTLDMYEQAGMRTFGGGRDTAEAQQPLLLEHNGNRIALVGCNFFGPAYAWSTAGTPGSAPCGPEFLEQVRGLKDKGYTVIATQQYTESYQYPPLPAQETDFRAIAAAGADGVSGSQGHHAQGFSFEGDSFIHYGLGNLFFDQMDMLGTRQAFVDTYTIYDGRLLNIDLWIGLIENYFLPRQMTAEERAQALQTVFQASGW